MSGRTHLLLQVDPGFAREARRYIATLPGVVDATETSGPYDVIATVAGEPQEVHRAVARARRAPGLCVLRVCVQALPVREAPPWEEGPGWTPWSAAVATNA